jgi:hypothetical protein
VLGDQRRCYGFPINRTFSSVEVMWEEVKNTDLHNIADDNCEFMLAVVAVPYPCFVLSVWVYVAAIFSNY